MIQEKDFLYRVPVKNVLVTTPRQQVRNPEILVDLEGGEFMHGNILDANSTNKLINQSVKDAVDNKLIESGYVTQDLLDAETTRATEQENSLKTLIGAETSARTKGDEDLGAKIKAEQTRAEGKEKEISDKLAIVDGDSNTEGSFRKAIADVIAAAPEDLDTLKEIADKLADNDDLHTALNQAITDKADASALLNEVTRATGAESALQTAINTKADATALSNYVLTAALNKQIDTLNTAISAKQDAGNYIPYEYTEDLYQTTFYGLQNHGIYFKNDESYYGYSYMCGKKIEIRDNNKNSTSISGGAISIGDRDSTTISIGKYDIYMFYEEGNTRININGIRLKDGDNNHVLTSDASTIDITQYALKTELPTVPTAVSQLTNDSNFITVADIDFTPYATMEALIAETKARTLALTTLEQTVTANTTAIAGKQDKGNYMEYSSKYDKGYTVHWELNTSEPITIEDGNGLQTQATYSGVTVSDTNTESSSQLTTSSLTITKGNGVDNQLTIGSDSITSTAGDGFVLDSSGITFNGRSSSDIPTAGGDFVKLSYFVIKQEYDNKIKLLETTIARLEARITALEAKHPEAAA